MNYSKLKISFFCLFLMAIIQLLVSIFIINNLPISILSFIAILLCGGGLWYTEHHTSSSKK